MGIFKLRVDYEDEPVIKAKLDKIDQIDDIVTHLKRKFK